MQDILLYVHPKLKEKETEIVTDLTDLTDLTSIQVAIQKEHFSLFKVFNDLTQVR